MNWRTIPIDMIEIYVREANILHPAGFSVAGDIAAASDEHLLAIPRFGQNH